MTSPTVTNKDELRVITNKFEEQVKEWKSAPGKVNDAVDSLKWSFPNMYAAVTLTRDKIQEDLETLIGKLGEAAEGIYAPFLFIDYAAEWGSAGSIVGNAANYMNNPEVSLEGYWDGNAYRAFKASAGSQLAAVNSSKEMCNKVHTELLTLAAEGRIFYKTMADGLVPLITEYLEGIGETATGVGAIWGINQVNAAVVNSVRLVTQAITGMTELQSKVIISSNELDTLIKHPAGFVSGSDGQDHWPSAVSGGYDQESDGWKVDA